MPNNVDYSDVTHSGQHIFSKAPVVPDGSFGDAQIGTTNPIQSTKLKHQHCPTYAQANGAAAVTETRAVHVARDTGTVEAIEAGILTAAVGAATVTIDLKKNGASILTAVITISSAQAAFARVAGVISSAAYVVGDVFTLVITATAGGGTLPQGLFVRAVFREGAG